MLQKFRRETGGGGGGQPKVCQVFPQQKAKKPPVSAAQKEALDKLSRDSFGRSRSDRRSEAIKPQQESFVKQQQMFERSLDRGSYRHPMEAFSKQGDRNETTCMEKPQFAFSQTVEPLSRKDPWLKQPAAEPQTIQERQFSFSQGFDAGKTTEVTKDNYWPQEGPNSSKHYQDDGFKRWSFSQSNFPASRQEPQFSQSFGKPFSAKECAEPDNQAQAGFKDWSQQPVWGQFGPSQPQDKPVFEGSGFFKPNSQAWGNEAEPNNFVPGKKSGKLAWF